MILLPETKSLLNKLKCPICKSDIDFIGIIRLGRPDYNFACVNNNQHYQIAIDCDSSFLFAERVYIYDDHCKYQLSKYYYHNVSPKDSITSEIIIYKIDPEGREIFSFEQKKLSLNGDLFDFSNFNVEKAVNKIKTILVFH